MTNAVVAIKMIDKLKHHRHVQAIERELKLLRKIVLGLDSRTTLPL